ncbi:hypothetical protein BDB00DRAFT_278475 [Zychaea mexicana]|uniref:uncharacterized protein n=1 Tax=Zychaea mexicana TaxID=64656 RepID=UPI0022FF3294|nr:uncharacterized protein BDB00DRAFT_278475 [Zychaea mexicana]KAI9494919.1 hypothetical protein BDB00DRAFT_278475 [Zychaea mexicana]
MMQTCDDYQLLELKKLLCKVMAEKYEEEGNTQEATISYATAGDVASLDKLADKALQRYLESGVLEQVVTETNEIRATIEKSTHYKFLFQYQRLRNLLEVVSQKCFIKEETAWKLTSIICLWPISEPRKTSMTRLQILSSRC